MFNPGNDFLAGAIVHDSLFAAWSEVRDNRLIVNFAKSPLSEKDAVQHSGNVSTISELVIVPNPAEDNANLLFQLSSAGNCSLWLFDTRGVFVRSLFNDVLSMGSHSVNVSTAGLANGDYVVDLRTPSGATRAKLSIYH